MGQAVIEECHALGRIRHPVDQIGQRARQPDALGRGGGSLFRKISDEKGKTVLTQRINAPEIAVQLFAGLIMITDLQTVIVANFL